MKNIMPPSDDQSPNIENDGTGAVNQSSSSTEDQVQRPSSASETKSIDEQRRDLLSRVEAALDGEVVLTEQAMIDGLDLLTELLQRENSCLSTAVSIWDYTSRATFTNRLTELVNVVCVKYETQTRVWLKRVVALRELLGQFCDTVDDKLKAEGIVPSYPRTITATSATHESEQEAILAARISDAHLSVGRAAVRVARSEEQAASLECCAVEAAQKALQVAREARETERRLADAALAEERKRQEEQERVEREERERKMTEEEAARRQADEERKRKAETSKKNLSQEEEETQRQRNEMNNPSKWPLFVYSVDPGDTAIGLGCVIRLYPGQMDREEIEVTRIDQLNCSLTLGSSDELISNVIEIRSSRDAGDAQRELDPPASVALPYVSQRNIPSREPIVMVMTGSDVIGQSTPWTAIAAREVVFDDIKDYKFVEVRVNSLQAGVRLAVVSRLKRETMGVSKRCLRVCSSVDPRITFAFNAANLTSKKSSNFTVEVQPVDLLSVQDVKHRCPEVCQRLLAASSIVRLTADCGVLPSTVDVSCPGTHQNGTLALPPALARQPFVVTLPVPPNPAKQRRPATSASDGRSTTIGGASGPAAASGGGRNDQGQSGSSNGSRATGDQANKGRPKTATSFYKSSSEEVSEDAVYLLTKDEDEHTDKWTIVSNAKQLPLKNTDIISFELHKFVKGRMLAVRKLVGGPLTEMEAAARQLELSLQRSAVNAVLRHSNGESATATTDVSVHFVQSGSVNRTVRKLADDGFPNGPPVGPEMLLTEGQRLIVRFRGNVCAADGRTELRVVYNSNIRTKLDFRAVVADKFAQKSIDVYRGFVQVYTYTSPIPTTHVPTSAFRPSLSNTSAVGQLADDSKTKITAGQLQKTQPRTGATTSDETVETLLCELLVTIPKPEPEALKPVVSRAPVVLHTEGVVDDDLLRHLASEIGHDWRHLAHSLGIRRVRLQAILRNHGTNESQQTVYEMLVSWMKKLPRAVNKAGLLRSALVNCGRPDLAEYVAHRQEELYQRSAIQTARGSTMRRAMVTVARHADLLPDWMSLCSLLGLNQRDIDDIMYRHQGTRERCYESLVCWAQQADDNADCPRVERTVQGLVQLLRKNRHIQLADIVQHECHGRG